MKYTKDYLRNLDRKRIFVPLTLDVAFKAVMMRNIDLFRDFLIMTMDLNISEEDNYIIFLDKELIKEHIREHGKVIDLNIKIGKNLIIDIEINTERYSTVKRRNDLYLEKLDTLSFEVGDDYDMLNAQYIYQLNLNSNRFEKEYIDERIIVSYDIVHNEIDDIRTKKYIKNLVFYRNKYYNSGDKGNFDEIFMTALMTTSFYELYQVMSNILSGKKLDRFMESVIDMSNDEFILHAWQKEKMDKLVQDNIKKEAIEEGLKEGIEQGIEQGVLQGIERGKEQKTIDIIKAMLHNKIEYDVISNVCGKSIDEIKKIEKSIKNR